MTANGPVGRGKKLRVELTAGDVRQETLDQATLRTCISRTGIGIKSLLSADADLLTPEVVAAMVARTIDKAPLDGITAKPGAPSIRCGSAPIDGPFQR